MVVRDLIDCMRHVYAAYNDGNAQPFFDLFTDDSMIRFVAPEEMFPFAAPRRGPEGAREAITLIVEQFEWLSYQNLELIAQGDVVFALNGGRLRHRESGRVSVINLADMVRFKDGKIAEFVEFFDSAGLYDWCQGGALPASALVNAANKAFIGEASDEAGNTAALKAAFSAYRDKNAVPLLGLFSEDSTYNSVASIADFPFAGPSFGKEEVEKNFRTIANDYALEKYDDLDYVAQGDLVAVHCDVAFRCNKTGKLAETEKIDLFRMHGGEIVEFNEIFDSLGARRAHEAD